jgi:uncharacterized protein with ACT and thioredoxin-like domain
MTNESKIHTKAGIMMKNKYSKGPYWKFKDHLSEESKNVVFYQLLTIMEEEYPKLFEEVEHLVDRNLIKDELIESISYLFKLHEVDEKFKNDLLNAINQYFETYHNVKGDIVFYTK